MSSIFFPVKGCDHVKEGVRRPLLKVHLRLPSIQHTYTRRSTCTKTRPEETHTIFSSGLQSYNHHYTRTWGFWDLYISFKTFSTWPWIKTWSGPLTDFTLPVASHFHYAIRNLTFHFTKKLNNIPNKRITFPPTILFEHILNYESRN